MAHRSEQHTEKLFHFGNEWFETLFEEMSSAQSAILLEIHFVDDSIIGKKLFKILIDALERGVSVKLIVDGFSASGRFGKKWSKLLIRKGAQYAVFNGLHSLRGVLTLLNQRSHKKVVVIDGKRAWVGSYNMDSRQLPISHGGEEWRDCGVRVTGPVVKSIIHGFYHAWSFCHQLEKKRLETVFLSRTLRLNHHSQLRKDYLADLIDRIDQAKERVWIENPYFVPDKELSNSLIRASERGIDVKIILPRKSDLKLFPLINSFFYNHLISKNIAIFEYLPHILHKKVFIVDNWMILGSSNLNSRTQKHDWEIDIALTLDSSKVELIQEFNNDLRESRLANLERNRLRFRFSRLLKPFFIGIKYFL